MPRSAKTPPSARGTFPSQSPIPPNAYGSNPPVQCESVTPTSPADSAERSAKGTTSPCCPRSSGRSVASPESGERPSAPVVPDQRSAPSRSCSASFAPATGFPSERRVTQTSPFVAPTFACTERSVTWPVTRFQRRQRSHALPTFTSGASVKVGNAWDRWRRWKRVTGQVTDLSVHAKVGATKGLVWVTRLSDGKPVAGAKLALHDRIGSLRWSGTTDADGLSPLPGLATLLPEERGQHGDVVPFALLSAESGGDVGVTLSHWTGGFEPYAFGGIGDWEGNVPRALGGVFAERGIYRPGESVHVKGIARSRKLGKLHTPTSGTVQVKVTSSRGKEVFSRAVPLTQFGTFSAEVPIEADAPLGGFRIEASWAGDGETLAWHGGFRVEEYRSPQFQVDVVAPGRQLAAGDAVKAQVLARYLFGGAMPGAQVRWTVARESTAFEPPGNAGFSFGTGSWWWDDGAPQAVSDVAASGEGETDGTGLLAVEAGLAEATGGRTFVYTVEAEVTDVNRQRIGRASCRERV